MPPEKPTASENVQKVIDAFKKDHELWKEVNQVFAKAYDRAQVTLTQSEKAELFSYIGYLIQTGMKWVRP